MNWFIARLEERSSWVGLMLMGWQGYSLYTALHSHDQAAIVTAAGGLLGGALAFACHDGKIADAARAAIPMFLATLKK